MADAIIVNDLIAIKQIIIQLLKKPENQDVIQNVRDSGALDVGGLGALNDIADLVLK